MILILFLTVYIFLAGRLTFTFPIEAANYFSYQTDAFFHGRLDIVNPNWEHDLSKYNNKLYMYWGPTPILLIFPFILFWGINFSDVLYTAIIGAFAPLIFYLTLNQLNKLEFTNLSLTKKILLTLFMGFGTVYFSVAIRGGVWFTSQTINILFILLSIYFMLRNLNTDRTWNLLLSGIFFGLAFWGRNTFILYFPLLVTLLVIKKNKHHFSIKSLRNDLLAFIFICILFTQFFGYYNYLRFNSFFETGVKYQEAADRYSQEEQTTGFFNVAYIPHNFYYNFINFPQLIQKFPFFDFDGEGNSFILMSPLFFTSLLILLRHYWRSKSLVYFNSILVLSFIGLTVFQLLFFGTGWFQFSARYMLDAIPFLLLILAEITEQIPTSIIGCLVLISIIFNTLGAFWLANITL
jgi:hypothetical protein